MLSVSFHLTEDGGQMPAVLLHAEVMVELAVESARPGESVRRVDVLADVASQRAMHPEDRFRICSVTKTFTASLVLMLVEEGVVGLDDRVAPRGSNSGWLPP